MTFSLPAGLENSHSVASVQELIKKPIISVPQQFIFPNKETPTISESNPSSTVPTIDFKLLVSTETELEKLHSTCKEWGIFQLVNHGVSSSLLDKLKCEMEEFYSLPLDDRMKYKRGPDESEGYGPAVRSEGKLEWGDRFLIVTNPTHKRKPHLFPELPSSMRDTLESYLLEMQKLSMNLLGFIAKALKLDLKDMEEMFDDGLQSVRMTYYPPCPQPELVHGLIPHSDPSGITILNQVNGVDGLQIKKDGVWTPITFLPDTLLVNVGDILEILSNGIYNSIEHRVTVNSEKERISITFFVNPNFEAEIGPATSLINPQNPAKFGRKGMEDYFKDYFSRNLYGKSYLEHIKIKRREATLLNGN